MGNFTNLTLDRKKIKPLLEALGLTVNILSSSSKNIQYEISKKDVKFKLMVHYKSNGTTTLQPQAGEQSFMNDICNEIKENAVVCNINEINASVILTDTDFATFLKTVKEMYPDSLQEQALNGGSRYILKKAKEGKFSFSYYPKSKKLLLQGKALSFFSFVVNTLIELGYDALTSCLRGTNEIILEEPKVLLEEHLPLLGAKLPVPVQNIMSSSLQFIKLKANFSDYTIIIAPALKTLEHVMIVVLEDAGYTYEKRLGFNMFQIWTPNNSHYLPKQDAYSISEPARKKLGKCYTFFNKQRHGLSHIGSDITEIRTIEDRAVALDLLLECVDLMEEISDEFHM